MAAGKLIALSKRSRGIKRRTTWNNSKRFSKRDFKSGTPDWQGNIEIKKY